MWWLWCLNAAAAPLQGSAQLPIPIVDAPYNLAGDARIPSMAQAADVAYGVERGALLGVHTAMDAAFPDNPAARKGVGLGVSWALVYPLTLVSGWMHEEWHRAVLGWHDIDSRNGIWHADAWSNGTISVDHVADYELSMFKQTSPGDMARLMSAGMESQHALASRFGDEAFLHATDLERLGPFLLGDTWTAPAIFANRAGNLLYLMKCGPDSDALTDAENQLRLTEASRDFTGLDCTAWAYDVRRPDETYAARGAHPYGVGVDRYRSWEDLNDDDRALLRTQAALQWLNLADPHLLGVNGFAAGEARWFVRLGHQLAPFGYALEAHGGLVTGALSALATATVYVSADGRPSPGVALWWVDVQLYKPFVLDAGLSGWLQPEHQRLDGVMTPGGRVEADLSWRMVERLDLRFGADVKAAGWVPGAVQLGPGWGFRVGMLAHLR